MRRTVLLTLAVMLLGAAPAVASDTDPATNVTSTGATLHGTYDEADRIGLKTALRFQTFENVPCICLPGDSRPTLFDWPAFAAFSPEQVSQRIEGLRPNTSYQFRLTEVKGDAFDSNGLDPGRGPVYDEFTTLP